MVVKVTFPEYGIKIINTGELVSRFIEPDIFKFYINNNLDYNKFDRDFKNIATHYIVVNLLNQLRHNIDYDLIFDLQYNFKLHQFSETFQLPFLKNIKKTFNRFKICTIDNDISDINVLKYIVENCKNKRNIATLKKFAVKHKLTVIQKILHKDVDVKHILLK